MSSDVFAKLMAFLFAPSDTSLRADLNRRAAEHVQDTRQVHEAMSDDAHGLWF
jgi:hypothetical protein